MQSINSRNKFSAWLPNQSHGIQTLSSVGENALELLLSLL